MRSSASRHPPPVAGPAHIAHKPGGQSLFWGGDGRLGGAGGGVSPFLTGPGRSRRSGIGTGLGLGLGVGLGAFLLSLIIYPILRLTIAKTITRITPTMKKSPSTAFNILIMHV